MNDHTKNMLSILKEKADAFISMPDPEIIDPDGDDPLDYMNKWGDREFMRAEFYMKLSEILTSWLGDVDIFESYIDELIEVIRIVEKVDLSQNGTRK